MAPRRSGRGREKACCTDTLLSRGVQVEKREAATRAAHLDPERDLADAYLHEAANPSWSDRVCLAFECATQADW
jgi:hypothetical protein